MTILDHTGAAALQRSRLVAALERAGDDGLTEAEVKEIGGYHWHNRLVELRRRGFVAGPGVGRAGNTANPPSQPDEDEHPSLVTGSPSTLFELPPRRHYEDCEAA